MTTRTIKMLGYTTGATVSIEWNGSPAWSGTVDAAGSFHTPAVLAEWPSPLDLTGPVPLTIQGHSGELMLVTFHANFIRPLRQRTLIPDAEWPIYRPTVEELDQDRRDESFDYQTKYGLTRSELNARILTIQVQSAAEHFCEPFFVDTDSDGKTDVMIQQVPQIRNAIDPYEGAWHWPVNAGSVLSCNVQIDPALIVTD